MSRIIQIVFILVILLCCGCGYYFMEPPLDPRLEAILPKSVHFQGWDINPNKDKIGYKIYTDPKTEQAFLLLPATKQTYPLPCFTHWLSNDQFYCYSKDAKAYEVDPTTFAANPIAFETHTITTTNLSQQLAQAQEIYVIPEYDETKIWLKTPHSYMLISQIENLPNVLSNTLGLTSTLVTYLDNDFYGRGVEKINSPNQAYYFSLDEQNITIYDIASHAKLVEYTLESKCQAIYLAAWAEDSSGVYFSGAPSCPIYNPPSAYERQLLKLKVPKP